MSLSSPLGHLRVGQIMSLSDIEHWDPNAKETVEVGQGLKTDAEIQSDCLDESLVGVARCVHILSKGTPIQRWSVLDSLWRLLELEGANAFDQLLPPLLKLLCTWETDIQIHAANVYTQILDNTKQLAIRIEKRETEELYQYDASELPPLPWMIDQPRIEKWILPTILLMADAEGSPLKEESAQHWLEPLFVCMGMITHECVIEKVIAFAIHKRDPTGAINSRVAAAKILGPLATLLKPQQIQESTTNEAHAAAMTPMRPRLPVYSCSLSHSLMFLSFSKLFPHVLSLCQDSSPYVRIVMCQQLNLVMRGLFSLPPISTHTYTPPNHTRTQPSKPHASLSHHPHSHHTQPHPPPSSASLSLLHKTLVEVETLISKDDCIEVKMAAWRSIVDMVDILPDGVRKQRIMPLIRAYCGTGPATPVGVTSHSITSASASSAAAHAHTLLQPKHVLSILMRIFGELMWKISADLLTDDGPTHMKQFINWYRTVVQNAYAYTSPSTATSGAALPTPLPPAFSVTPQLLGLPTPPSTPTTNMSVAAPANSPVIGGLTVAAVNAAAAAAAATPPPASIDVELRRIAAFQLPAIVKICLGGSIGKQNHLNTPHQPNGYAHSNAPHPNSLSSSSLSHASTSSSSSSSAPASTLLAPKTLTLLESLHALFIKFAGDSDAEVRRIAASSLSAVMQLWPGDLVLRQFKDVFLSFLLVSKQGGVVTEAALRHIDVILDVFHANKGDDPMAPMLGEVLRCITLYDASLGLNWRRKLALVDQAGRCYPRLFTLDMVNLHEKFIPILFDVMKNGPMPLKHAAVETLVTFIKTFPYTYRRHELCARVAREFGMGKSYTLRMIYIQVVRVFFHRFSYKWLKKHIFTPFLAMHDDPVSNVRRKFIEVLPLLKYTLKSTPSDLILLEQFKSVVGVMSGCGPNSTGAGDSDPDVRSRAVALWHKMDSIDINTEYDRLNRKKEGEEDAMDREEESLALNLNLSGGGGGGGATLRGAILEPTNSGDSKKKIFEKRRNHSVIVTSSNAGGGMATGSKDTTSLASGSGSAVTNSAAMQLPLSSRTARAKLKVASGLGDSPPASPMAAADIADLTPSKEKGLGPRSRNSSFSSPGQSSTSSTSRPGSSAGHSLSSPPSAASSTKSPNSGPSLKLRPRSHSVLLSSTHSGMSNGGSGSGGDSHASAPLSFGGVAEEDEFDEDQSATARKQTRPNNPNTTNTHTNTSQSATPLSPTASFAISTSGASLPSKPTGAPSPKHKRRPSMLTTGNNNSPSSAATGSAATANVALTGASSSASGFGSVSSASLVGGGSLLLKSPLTVQAKPVAEKPSIISALLRGNGFASTSAAASDKATSAITATGPGGGSTYHYGTGAHSDDRDREPLSPPMTRANSHSHATASHTHTHSPVGASYSGPRKSSSPPTSLGTAITASRIRHSPTHAATGGSGNGSNSARAYSNSNSPLLASLHANSAVPAASLDEKLLVLPKLPAQHTPSSAAASDFKCMTPRIQRMNLHSNASAHTAGMTSPPMRPAHPPSNSSPTPPTNHTTTHSTTHRTKRIIAEPPFSNSPNLTPINRRH